MPALGLLPGLNELVGRGGSGWFPFHGGRSVSTLRINVPGVVLFRRALSPPWERHVDAHTCALVDPARVCTRLCVHWEGTRVCTLDAPASCPPSPRDPRVEPAGGSPAPCPQGTPADVLYKGTITRIIGEDSPSRLDRSREDSLPKGHVIYEGKKGHVLSYEGESCC